MLRAIAHWHRSPGGTDPNRWAEGWLRWADTNQVPRSAAPGEAHGLTPRDPRWMGEIQLLLQ